MALDVENGVTSTGIIVNGGTMRVLSGGTAILTTVNSRGECQVFDGGQATSTTVNDMGLFNVSGGGTATIATIQSGGVIHVSSGATVSGVEISQGGKFIFVVASKTYIQGTNEGKTFEIKDGVVSGLDPLLSG